MQTNNEQRNKALSWTFWFGALCTILWSAIAIRYAITEGTPQSMLGWAYALLFYLGHFFTFALVLIIFPMGFLAILFPHRPILVGLSGVIVGFAVSLLLLIDTFVFDQYRFHINRAMLELLLGPAGGEIFVFSYQMYFFALLASIVLLALCMGLLLLAKKLNIKKWPTATMLTVALLGYHLIHSWANAVGHTEITRQTTWLPLAHPTSAKRAFARMGFEVVQDNGIKNSANAGPLNYPLEPIVCAPIHDQMNILIIAIDAWRFDAFSPSISPHIYQYAQNAWAFQEHFSTANSTRIGIFTLFYGLPGTYWHSFLGIQKGPVLIEETIKRGYDHIVFSSSRLNSPEFDRTVFAALPISTDATPGSSKSERDRTITNQFKDYLSKRDPSTRPFFGFLFYDSPHGYDFPPSYPKVFEPSWEAVNYMALNNSFDPLPFFNRYKNSIHYTDSLIHEVLQSLEQHQLGENTVVVITSDHGQEMNDNRQNYWGHNGNFSRYQSQVPLVVMIPGQKPRKITHRTSHFDIVPTLMTEILGCKTEPSAYSSGVHLMNGVERRALVFSSYNNKAIVDGDKIMLIDHAGGLSDLTLDLQPAKSKIDPKLISAALHEMKRFYE